MSERAGAGTWRIVALLWGAMALSHVVRVALSVVAPTLMTVYHIPPRAIGYVLSGWNWTYTPSLLLAGPIVDRFGPWIVLGVTFGLSGLATVALPTAGTVVSLFVLRALFGTAHSVLLPSNAAAISRCVAPERRATIVGLVFSGNQGRGSRSAR